MNIKKTTAILLALSLALSLCACDFEANYSDVQQHLEVPQAPVQSAPAPAAEEEPKPDEPAAAPAPAAQQPAQSDKKDETQTEQPQTIEAKPDITWPLGVPQISDYVTYISSSEKDGVYKAQFLLTQKQLDSWLAALKKAGFSGDDELHSDKWAVSYSLIKQAAGESADYRVTIQTVKYTAPAVVWPVGFEKFPEYSDGNLSFGQIEKNGMRTSFELKVQSASEEKYSEYILALEQAGFVLAGENCYARYELGKLYSVLCSFNSAAKTATLRYSINAN